jgi:type IV pilus assembly protein PilB
MSDASTTKLQEAIIAGNIPEIVKNVLSIALERGASDIHIEPGDHTVRNRFRVDGVLREIVEYPANIHAAVAARIKIMSNLKIDEQRKPQDGRLQMTTDDHKAIELRVSTLPTIHGEKICMRLQDKSREIPDLPELGIAGSSLERIEKTLALANGIVLVTGPTGSGKTTTLYSGLARLNKPEVNIVTLEDPIEYEMPGLAQSQVQPVIGYDFASGLRTALRQDPDIIMVGEIRDQETIEIAIKAALTGHLVFSTIHTNSAVATITRLMDMGVKPFKITSSLRTIQAQRLVRKLCLNCREAYEPDEQVQEDIKSTLSNCEDSQLKPEMLENIALARSLGCDLCDQSGFKGRLGLYEVALIDRDLEKIILSGAMEGELEAAFMAKGMTSLKQDGYLKALQGLTTLEEVIKVVAI